MDDFNPEFLAQQEREWQAWRDACAELKALGHDFNAGEDGEQLHNALVKWGEELAELRRLDPDPTHRVNALNERREAYQGTPV